ncbi:MAG: dockerin type I domain-containing protein [Planctomycetota bacterium]
MTGLDGSGQPFEAAYQGMATAEEDGSFTALGVFDDPDVAILFDPDPDGVTEGDINGDVSFDVPLPSTVSVLRIEIDQFSFSLGDADVNADGIVCYDDYAAIVRALGTSFGQVGYTPRADLNGDLSVDSQDLQIAQQTSCIADMNCDGVVNFFDLGEYLAFFNAPDDFAETDGLPGINFFDLQTYLGMFSVGCP